MYYPDEQNVETPIQNAEDYVANVKKLKEQTVDKELYEKVLQDTKVLRDAILEGTSLEGNGQEATKKPEREALVKELLESSDTELSNAQYVKKALELRQAIIDDGELDPFLPVGAKIQPTGEDIAKAQRVAEGLQYCLEEATREDGTIDDDYFNAALKKVIAEDSPLLAAKLASNKQGKRRK